MTTDGFQLNTGFDSLFRPTSGVFGFAGMTSNGFVKGLDGNHYRIAQDFTYTGAVALCVETGNRVGVTVSQAQAELTLRGLQGGDYDGTPSVVAAPGTPYFYVFMTRPLSPGLDFEVAGLLYKVTNDSTVAAVGCFSYTTTNSGQYAFPNMFGGAVVNNQLVCVGTGKTSGGTGALPVIGTFSLAEGLTPPPVFKGVCLTADFFSYAELNRSSENLATVVPMPGNTVGIVMYISQADYDEMQTNIFPNPQWSDVTGPSVLWFLSTDSDFTDVSDQFDLSDRMRHLDGMASTDYNDDYMTPQTFAVSDRTYLMFARSYTRPADLEPTGTNVRGHIYLWDGTTGTSVFDATSALFDPVLDCGVDESGRTSSYPTAVQGLYDPSDKVIRYCWHGAGSALAFDFVFGDWITVEQGEIEAFGVTFSALDNTSFTDWQTADASGFGADFSSDLLTYYFYSDNQTMWMQSPYVFAYVATQGRGPSGLLMTPEWDFSEASGSHKFARITEVYRDTDQSLVSVTKNRVRGKGRALRFHWQSEQSKDFNLLGWSVDLDQNTKD